MEGVLRELHHLMAFGPGIQFHIHDRTRNEVCHRCHRGSGIIDTTAAEEYAHTLTHQFFLRVGCAELVELLAPLVDLVSKVHLDRAYGLATQTERTGADIARVLLCVAEHTEVDADRTGDEITITVATTATIDRTSIHARAAADTFQGLPVFWVADPLTASVIYEDDVHRVRCRTSLTEMRSVSRGRLTCTSATKHALEDGQTVVVGDDLLQTDGCYMQFQA